MNHAPLNKSKQKMALLALAVACPFVQAQTEGYISPSSAAGTSEFSYQSGINSREISRRQAQAEESKQLLQEGRSAYAEKKYKQALDKYKEAWDRIPKAPATSKQQEFIIQNIGDASIAVAMEYAKVGRYDDAEQLLLDVLSREPGNKRARHELSMLRDPIRNNPALTPEHVKNVEEVNRLLTTAYGYYNLGQYDESYAEFQRVLAIDPYNSAARRGQEAVSKRRSAYYQTAYDSLRAKALAEVDAAWIPQEVDNLPEMQTFTDATAPISESIIENSNKLESIEIATISFEDTPVEEALDFLRGEARKRGLALNFIFEKPQQAPAAAAAAAPVDEFGGDEFADEEVAAPVAVQAKLPEAIIPRLSMQNVTAKELLQMMCSQAGCQYRIDDNAIVVYQTGAGVEKMFRRQWTNIPRDFFTGSGEDDGDAFASGGGFEESTSTRSKIDPVATLKQMGVNFPRGATAEYSMRTGILTVNNTPDGLDWVEEAVNTFRQDSPQMVKVQAKFVEISQTNEEELSFDWVVNPFSINDSGTTTLGGGGSYDSDGNYTSGTVTGGNRSGTSALTGNTLSSLLESGSTSTDSTATPSPGILSLTGVFDSGSYQMIMRGLSQKKGVDIMMAPSLVARPGDLEFTPDPDPLASDQQGDDGCAKIEVVRRFMYATAYEPPEISSSNNNNSSSDSTNSSSGYPVASPANPAEWAVEDVGVTLKFKVDRFEGDDNIIKFSHFTIKVVDFEGFINYGSPITSAVTTTSYVSSGEIEQVMLTENRIDMPIFSRRYVNSNPCIFDGHTIAIGGLIEDNIQKVEDKVPILGDLPLIGRLFRSNSESHIRKNLIVFVTAEKIDPTGKPTRIRDTGTGDDPNSSTGSPSLFPEDSLAQP